MDSRSLEKHLSPAPEGSVGLQELEHSGIVCSRLACQRPGNEVGQVVIAEEDGVAVPVGGPHDGFGSPDADPSHAPQAASGVVGRQVQRFFESPCPASTLDQGGSSTPLDPQRVQVLIAQLRNAARQRRHAQIGSWTRSARSVPGDQPAISDLGLLGRDLLAEHGRRQDLPHGTGGSQAEAALAPMEVPHEAGRGKERRDVFVEAEKTGQSIQQLLGARSPCRDFQPAPVEGDGHGRLTGLAPRRDPCGAIGVEDTGTERTECRPQVEGLGRLEPLGRHLVTVAPDPDEPSPRCTFKCGGRTADGAEGSSMSRGTSPSESGDLIREAMTWLTDTGTAEPAADEEPTATKPVEPTRPNRSWDDAVEPVDEPDWVPTPAPATPPNDLWSSVADSHVLQRDHRPEPVTPPLPSEPAAYQPAPPAEHGDGPSTARRTRNAAIVILARVAIGLAVLGGFVAFRNVTSEETVTVSEMAPGTCLQDPGPGLVGNAPVVDCSKAHDLEVFALVQLPFADDAPLPEEEALFDSAFESCLPRFESYTGQDWDTSPFYLDAFVPDRHSWKNGDREAICFLFQLNSFGDIKDSTGSARRGSV